MATYHMPKGYGLFLSGTSVITVSALALLSVLIAWAVGGNEFKDSIFGNIGIVLFVGGILTGAVLVHYGQKRGHRQQ